MTEGNAKDVDSNPTENGARESVEEIDELVETEDEVDDVECHREPIDHLLKVTFHITP